MVRKPTPKEAVYQTVLALKFDFKTYYKVIENIFISKTVNIIC